MSRQPREATQPGVSEHQVRLEPSGSTRRDYLNGRRCCGCPVPACRTARRQTICPPRAVFRALDATPFEQVKVVILGQDPYHGPGQAHGLCFSVLPGVPPPPSLVNIFSEIGRDLGIARPDHGCLIPWARQGVLLLNSVLTVERGLAGSHQGKGWEGFTDAVIDHLNREREGLVFLLWGSYAEAP
jgi:uracil-DNA glycosylase